MCLRCVSPTSLSCGKSCKPVYSEWPRIGSIDVVTLSQRFSIRIFFFFLITRLKEFLALDRILSWLLFVIKNKYLIFLILLQLFQTLEFQELIVTYYPGLRQGIYLGLIVTECKFPLIKFVIVEQEGEQFIEAEVGGGLEVAVHGE